jgi:hypothetical protein
MRVRQQFDRLDDLFDACLRRQVPDHVFRGTITPQPPASWIMWGALTCCIPPLIIIPLFFCFVFLVTFPIWFSWLIYVCYFKDVGLNLGDYLFVHGDAFTIIRGVQLDPKTRRYRAYSTVTWPIAEIKNFGAWLTAAVMENQAGSLPIQTKVWVYFVKALPLPILAGVESRHLDSLEPLSHLVPALRGNRAVGVG